MTDITFAMFPHLHHRVLDAVVGMVHLTTWFNALGTDSNSTEKYSTNIMGTFECRNQNLFVNEIFFPLPSSPPLPYITAQLTSTTSPKSGWDSKIVAILILKYPDGGYNAHVFKHRCKSCNKLGALTLDEQSYVDRVSYRLKKWAGVKMDRPEYRGGIEGGPPHEYRLCEGCKKGHCRRSAY